ncbi:hypothetical protein CMV_005930 [Castanea mollissima]|uniref:Uncharacterized protein n=1 Tax=Castanea mollissima TaxID=60419 RepID=A0A8J4VRQ1_9ROSI|nr:hypothetical protein CMV_005930 [Castanea mollissima]
MVWYSCSLSYLLKKKKSCCLSYIGAKAISLVYLLVARCIETLLKDTDEAAMIGESPLVAQMSSVVPAQMEGGVVARRTMMPQEDCDEAEKAGESPSVSSMSVVKPTQVMHCSDKLRKVCSNVEKDKKSTSVSPMSTELPQKVTQCL